MTVTSTSAERVHDATSATESALGADLRAAVAFHYAHGGYSVERNESVRHARERWARTAAAAERYAHEQGWSVVWSDDWSIDHAREYGRCYAAGGPDSCECATLYDGDGAVLASIGCVDDADDVYRRVVAADLYLEAAGQPCEDCGALPAVWIATTTAGRRAGRWLCAAYVERGSHLELGESAATQS